MKISKSKCNWKKTKIHLILIQSKIPFVCTKLVALRYISKFSRKVIEWFLKKRSLYFTSPMKIFKYKCNSKTQKKEKIHLFFIQFKIPFECTKSLALGWYSQDLTKKWLSSFWEKFTLLHLTWKFLSQRVTTKPPKIHLIFIQSKIFLVTYRHWH